MYYYLGYGPAQVEQKEKGEFSVFFFFRLLVFCLQDLVNKSRHSSFIPYPFD